ncbi:MAG: hypothetical protein L3J52_02680, partial [Proteobacteria bacterium]|nr:hypothetical protein [Pseudomonadota bacterium]
MKINKILCVSLVFLTANVFAQKIDDAPDNRGVDGSIIDGGVTYSANSFGLDAASGDLTGAGTGDHLFEFGWFFGVSGTAETTFGDPSSSVYVGNTATINWTGLGGVFDATETVVVTEVAAGQGSITNTMLITNTSVSDQAINFYHYADIDVAGSFGSNNAVLTNSPDFITV